MAPTLVPTVQSAFARVQLTLTWPGIQLALVERLDPDGVWRPVRSMRGDDYQVCLDSCAFFDHEAPFDAAVTYRATSPQGTGTVVTDTFTRTTSSSWGVADTGQTWTMTGTASEFSTTGTQARHNTGTAGTADVSLLTVTNTDTDFLVLVDCVSLAGFPATSPARTLVHLRDDNVSNRYRFEFVLQVDQTIRLEFNKTIAGTGSALTSLNTGVGYGGKQLWLRVQLQGSTMRCRFWTNGTVEPTTWNLTYTDTGPTVSSGPFIRFASQLDAGFTGTTPYPRLYDNLTIKSLAPLTVTAGPVTVPSAGRVWLKDPGRPAANRQVRIADVGARVLPARRGVFRPIGDDDPIVVSDVRQHDSATITLVTDGTWADLTNYRSLFAPGSSLLLQYPSGYGGESLWISPGDVGINPTGRKATSLRRTLPVAFDVEARPPGATNGAVGITCADVPATYATCTALAAAKATCTALATSVV